MVNHERERARGQKKFLAAAINPEHKGALRAKAKRQGLIHGDENLSQSDLEKLESEGGTTAKQAHLAEEMKGFRRK